MNPKIIIALLSGVVAAAPMSFAQDQSVREERRARLLERFDKDGDGKLSEQEMATARETIRAEREASRSEQAPGSVQRRAGRPGMPAMSSERRQELLERFDKDGDGKLSDEEMAAAREYMREQMARRRENQGDPAGGRVDGERPTRPGAAGRPGVRPQDGRSGRR